MVSFSSSERPSSFLLRGMKGSVRQRTAFPFSSNYACDSHDAPALDRVVVNVPDNCDELLDSVRALLLSAPFDVQKASLLIGNLQLCADQAASAGDGITERRLRDAAKELSQHLS
jgi:hypothetical protein